MLIGVRIKGVSGVGKLTGKRVPQAGGHVNFSAPSGTSAVKAIHVGVRVPHGMSLGGSGFSVPSGKAGEGGY